MQSRILDKILAEINDINEKTAENQRDLQISSWY